MSSPIRFLLANGDFHEVPQDSERLDFSRQSPMVQVPENIGSMQHLRSFAFRGATVDAFAVQVESDYHHPIHHLPDSIGNLLNLEVLDLAGTQIQSLPESIGYLENLQVLNLSSCPRLQILPESIGKLKNLRILALAHSSITRLPESIGGLDKLQVLHLSRSSIKELPQSLCKLRNLRKLDLTDVFVQGVSVFAAASPNEPQLILDDLRAYFERREENEMLTFEFDADKDVNRAMKIAIQQYFLNFGEYLKKVKNIDGIEVNISNLPNGYKIHIARHDCDIDKDLLAQLLEEYTQLAKKDPEELKNVVVFTEKDEAKQSLALVELQQQVSHLKMQLQIANLRAGDFRAILDNVTRQPLQIINSTQVNTQINNHLDLKIYQQIHTEIAQARKNLFLDEDAKINYIGEQLDNAKIENERHYEKVLEHWLPTTHHKFLHPNSRQYIKSGLFLFDIFKEAKSTDFSPCILQFCRAMEGELKTLFAAYETQFLRKSKKKQEEALRFDSDKNNPLAFLKLAEALRYKNLSHNSLGLYEQILLRLSPLTELETWGSDKIRWSEKSPLQLDLLAFLPKYLRFADSVQTADFIRPIYETRMKYRNACAHPSAEFGEGEAQTALSGIKNWLRVWAGLLN